MRVFVVAVAGLMVAAGAQAQQNAQAQHGSQTQESTQGQQSTQAQQKAQARAFIQEQLEEAKFALEYGDCPGAFRAQQQPAGPTMWTVAQEDKNRKGQPKGPGLHVEFEAKNVKTPMNKVQALELSVSYLPAGSRVMPVESGTDAKSPKESKKTFVLQQEAAHRFDADLLVGPAATITRVHLVSATFADGNVWRSRSEDVCSVAPSLYMPVEAKR